MRKIIKDTSELDGLKYGFDLAAAISNTTEEDLYNGLKSTGLTPIKPFNQVYIINPEIQIPKTIYNVVPNPGNNDWECDNKSGQLEDANILVGTLYVGTASGTGEKYSFIFIRASDSKVKGKGLSQVQPFQFAGFVYYSDELLKRDKCLARLDFKDSELQKVVSDFEFNRRDVEKLKSVLKLKEESYKHALDFGKKIRGYLSDDTLKGKIDDGNRQGRR
ncbi:MAG: hypothetical protein FWE72_01560 [Spirochaetaceae bacterium]|nr:hypothetical protein [Spirochaetaceae bacterium]